ncbi:MAG: GNAT family N-acetyltransferase [Ilumatobacteraceae bacterium]
MSVLLRPLAVADLPAVVELMNDARRVDGSSEVMTLDELADELDGDRVVLETDTRIALDGDTIVGVVYTFNLPSDVREVRCYVFGTVHPEHRRRGIGTELMQWAIERARVQVSAGPSNLPRYIRVNALEQTEGAHALFRSLGMQPVRTHESLIRPVRPALQVDNPAGVRITPWPDERSEEIRQTKNAAFADHWGSTPVSPDDWHAMTHGYGARLDLSLVALDDDDHIIGYCLNKRFPDDDALKGRAEGSIDNLATLRAWRGRGVASALVARSVDLFAAAGLSHALIDVDAENPTGAARLYRHLGFEIVERSITSQLGL